MAGFQLRGTMKRRNMRKKKGKEDDPSRFTEGTESIQESVDSNVPIKVIHTTIENNSKLSSDEVKKLEKDSKNKLNLGKLYSSTDPDKSRESFLQALEFREKAHSYYDENDETPARVSSIQELAQINDKLGELAQKSNDTEEAISRYNTAYNLYESLPDPPANKKKAFGEETLNRTKPKGAKVETKEESITRLKGILSKIDPSFVDKDPTPQSKRPSIRIAATAVSFVTQTKKEKKEDVKKKNSNEDDEFRKADIYEAFSVASSSLATAFTEDDEPIEYPKINDEDYHLAQIKFSESNYSEAKDYYMRSFDTYTNAKSTSRTSAHVKSSRIIKFMLQERIAMCYGLLKDFPNAIRFYQDCLKDLLEEVSPKASKKSTVDEDDEDNEENDNRLRNVILFRIYIKLANVYVEIGTSEEAITCYVKAFPILIETKRITMDEEINAIIVKCVHGHDAIAKKAKKRKKINDALLNYKVMLDLMKIYMNQSKIYKTMMQHDYLHTAKTIGSIYIEMDRYQLAFEFFHNIMKGYSFDPNTEEKRETKIIAVIYHNMAILAERRGKYRAALGFYAKSLERKRKVFVKSRDVREKIGKTVLYMAFVHYQIDEEETALQYFKEAIEIYNMQEAKTNYDEYASVYQAVTTIYAKQDEIENAIYYTKQKINLAERCDDQMDIGIGGSSLKKDLAEGYHNMGLFYSYRKQYSQSIECYRKSFEMKKVLLSQKQSKPMRKSIFSTLRNLAAALNTMNELDDAAKAYKDCLLYTDDIIDRVSTYNKIGVIMCKMNKSSSAMEYYTKALQEESALQEENVMIKDEKTRKLNLESKKKLHVSLLNNAGNCVEDIDTAIEYYEKAHDLRSSNHSGVSSSSSTTCDGAAMGITYNMGLMYMKNKDYVNAVDCFLEYLDVKGYNSSSSKTNTYDEKEKKSMEEIAAVLNNIGNVKYNQGLYEEAVDFFSKSLRMKESIYGSHSAKLSLTVSNLGTSYYHIKDYESALIKTELALNLLKSSEDIGSHDENLETSNRIATLHNKIGNIYVKTKEYNLATTEYHKAYRMKKELLEDEQHPELLLVKHNIALIHVKTGNLEEALSELQSILERKVSALGQDHIAVVKLMLDISGVLYLTKQLREARRLCELALAKFRKANLPSNHSYMLQAEHTLKKIEIAQKWF